MYELVLVSPQLVCCVLHKQVRANFRYLPTIWLGSGDAFAIAPSLSLEGGPNHASARSGSPSDVLPCVFADAAPDSWGRRLLERQYGMGLSEFEYLTLSDDFCGQGALRFCGPDGDILKGTATQTVPRLIDLEVITSLARAYEQGQDLSAQDIQALAGAAGSGGARPKANVLDGEDLWLAKFTSVNDRHPIERVEIATLSLAKACGIRTPDARLELVDTAFPVALIKRFDRRGPGLIFRPRPPWIKKVLRQVLTPKWLISFRPTVLTPRKIATNSSSVWYSQSWSAIRMITSRTTAFFMSVQDDGAYRPSLMSIQPSIETFI
jgi:HipA-like C-terminal domain